MPLLPHDGGELWYHDRGAGPVVLLVHGSPLDHRVFLPLIEQLAGPQRRCVAYDLRGHGRSLADASALDLDRHAGDLLALASALAAGPVDLVGLSLGGVIALRCAAASPELVRSLAVVDASVLPPEEHRRAAISGLGAELLRSGRQGLARRLMPMLLGSGEGRRLDGDARERALLASMVESTPYETILATYRWLAGRGGEDLELIGTLRTPLLLAAGEHDPSLAGDALETHASAAVASPLVEVARVAAAGHLMPLERPGELAGVLREFWARAAACPPRS